MRQRGQASWGREREDVPANAEGFSPSSSLFQGRYQRGGWQQQGSPTGDDGGGGCRSPGQRERTVRVLKHHGSARCAGGRIRWCLIELDPDSGSERRQGRRRQGRRSGQDLGSGLRGNSGQRGSGCRQGAPPREGSSGLRHPARRHRTLTPRKPHRHARRAQARRHMACQDHVAGVAGNDHLLARRRLSSLQVVRRRTLPSARAAVHRERFGLFRQRPRLVQPGLAQRPENPLWRD